MGKRPPGPHPKGSFGNQERSIRPKAMGIGIATAVLSTVVTYVAVRLDPYGISPWTKYVWLVYALPLILAVVLSFPRRTRSVATGLAFGLTVTWLVAVPTCVVVTLATVPVFG